VGLRRVRDGNPGGALSASVGILSKSSAKFLFYYYITKNMKKK